MSLRRVTILLDRSSSMAGAPIGQAGAFIEWSLVYTLKANRHLYGQVELGLIAFDILGRHAEYVAGSTPPGRRPPLKIGQGMTEGGIDP